MVVGGGGDQGGSRAGAPPRGPRSAAGPDSTRGKGRISRTTGLPQKKARNGVGIARRLLAEAEVTKGLRLDSVDVALLKRISANPPRNALAMVSALKLRLEYSQRKPKAEVEVSGTVQIIDPYAVPREQ